MPECRLCLKNRSKSKLISVFNVDKDNRKTSDKIHECTSIEISEWDVLPKVVCNYCLKNLTVAYRFRQECRRNDTKLRKRFNIIDDTEQKYTPHDDQATNHAEDKWPIREVPHDNKNQETADNSCSKDLDIKDDLDNAIDNLPGLPALEKRDGQSKGTSTIHNNVQSIKDHNYHRNELSSDVETNHIKLEAYDDMSSEGDTSSKVAATADQNRLQEVKPGVVAGATRKKYRKSSKSQIFVCKVCGKVFKSNMGLQGHERRHTGEKPFVCQVCGKSFHVVNELKKHSLVHSGLKPYQCRQCGRSFSDWGSRFKHERCHSGERPYKCEECGKNFAYASVLANHKLTHSGIKNFSCDICEKKFTLKFHLTNHNRKYHPM